MTNKKRIEFDSLGSKKIDQNKLWGAQTQRSLENFKIGSEKIPSELIIALGQQKKAAAEANIELGVIDKKLGLLISKACDDIINLKLIEELIIELQSKYSQSGVNLIRVSSGYRFQVAEDCNEWVTNFYPEKPQKYSRALMETLALIIYKQPITSLTLKTLYTIICLKLCQPR